MTLSSSCTFVIILSKFVRAGPDAANSSLSLNSLSVSISKPTVAGYSFVTLFHPAVGVLILLIVPIGACIAPLSTQLAFTFILPSSGISNSFSSCHIYPFTSIADP